MTPTAFNPAQIEAFIKEFEAGKRILVLTATTAELVKTRQEVQRFFGQPHVAVRLTAELVSANYGRDKATEEIKKLIDRQVGAGS